MRKLSRILPIVTAMVLLLGVVSVVHAEATVSTVAITSNPGTDNNYATGDTITVSLTFSEAVTVTGTPYVVLADVEHDVRRAAYSGDGSSMAAQPFSYTVLPGDRDTDGVSLQANSLTLNGGGIQTTSDSTDATLTHSAMTFANHNVDNDTRGVTVSPTSLTVAEGGSGMYTVKLDSQPTAEVTVSISSDIADVSVNPATLTFTTSNWATSQRVTATANQDDIDKDAGVTATLTHMVSGGDYGPVSATGVTVTVNDNDTRGITITPTSLTVNEGDTNTYTIVLDTEPTDTVTVAISSNNTDVTLSASPLTVWDTALTVTVSAAEDADSTHDTATVTHTVTGGDYNFVINVIVTVTDNDTPGVTVTPPLLTVGEGGTGRYTVRLNTQPSGNVMVAISSNNTDVTVSSSTLTFTTTSWSTEQTVTVSAGQDADAANDMATLTHNPSGGGYGSVSNAILMVTVTDYDTARLMLSTTPAPQVIIVVEPTAAPTPTVVVAAPEAEEGPPGILWVI